MTKPKPPGRLGPSGRVLWAAVAGAWHLDADELACLEQACRTADELATLEAALAAVDPVVEGSTGQPRAHPLYEEVRRHRETLRRLLADIRVPSAPGASGVSDQARAAASVRWRRS